MDVCFDLGAFHARDALEHQRRAGVGLVVTNEKVGIGRLHQELGEHIGGLTRLQAARQAEAVCRLLGSCGHGKREKKRVEGES
jgi:hypothetical protein